MGEKERAREREKERGRGRGGSRERETLGEGGEGVLALHASALVAWPIYHPAFCARHSAHF